MLRRLDKGYYIRRLVHLVQKLFLQDKRTSRLLGDRLTIVVGDRTSRVSLLVVGSVSAFVFSVLGYQLVRACSVAIVRTPSPGYKCRRESVNLRTQENSTSELPVLLATLLFDTGIVSYRLPTPAPRARTPVVNRKDRRFRAQSEPIHIPIRPSVRFATYPRHIFRQFSTNSDRNGEVHVSYALYDLKAVWR